MEVYVRRLRLEPGHRFPRHAHQSWSFGLVGAGSVRLWRAGAWHATGLADATVLHPGEMHEGVIDPERGMWYTAVTVPEGLVAAVVGERQPVGFVDLRQPAGPVRRLVFSTHATELEERRERTIAAISVLFAGTKGGPAAAAPPSGGRLAAAVKRRLDADFTRPVQISVMARDLAVAPATVIREFRQRYAVPPYAYVVSRRVDLARQLLDAGHPPAHAAARAGFYDQAHLNRHFTRLVGVTPGVYRQG